MAITVKQYADIMKCLELCDLNGAKAGFTVEEKECIAQVKQLMYMNGAFAEITEQHLTQLGNIKIKLELIR